MLAMIIIIIKENHVTFRDKVSFWRSVGSVAQSTFKEAESLGPPVRKKENQVRMTLKLKSALVCGIFQRTKVEFDWTKYVIMLFLVLCELNEPVLALFMPFIMYWSKLHPSLLLPLQTSESPSYQASCTWEPLPLSRGHFPALLWTFSSSMDEESPSWHEGEPRTCVRVLAFVCTAP